MALNPYKIKQDSIKCIATDACHMGLIRPRNKDHKSISLTLTDDSVPMKHEEKALTLAEAETWRLADVK